MECKSMFRESVGRSGERMDLFTRASLKTSLNMGMVAKSGTMVSTMRGFTRMIRETGKANLYLTMGLFKRASGKTTPLSVETSQE